MTFSQDEPHESEHGRLAPIETLHRDATLSIIGQILDLESLLNLMKASPNARRHFRSYEGVTCRNLLIRRLGSHLPLAVARLEASKAEWRPRRPLTWNFDQANEYSIKLDHFCDHHLSDQPTKLQVPAQYFTLKGTFELLAFHRCVSDWTSGISLRIILQPAGSLFRYSNRPHNRQLNDRERNRVTRILYVTELISILLPQRRGLQDKEPDKDWETFWRCFAPWEFTQYLEMQAVIFEFLRRLSPFHHGLPSGKDLSELYAYMRRIHLEDSGDWIHFYEVLSLQAGLEALKPAVDVYMNVPKVHSRAKLFDIVDDFVEYPEMRTQWSCRFITEWRWRHYATDLYRIYPEHKNIWLKQVKVPSRSFKAYSFDITHVEEKYEESDEGPIACWLYDLLRYGERHKQDGFRLRDDLCFFMTSFWDRARWHTAIESRMPSMKDLKEDASTRCLTDRDRVVLLADID
ncbi:hypothetical protein Hte_004981 [Hypoxylon texense]